MIKEKTPNDSFLAYTIARNSGETQFEVYCPDQKFREALRDILSRQNYFMNINTKNGNLIIEL